MPSINAVSGVAILSTLLTLAQASPAVQSTTAQAWDDWNNVKSSTRPVVDTTTTTTKSNKASTTSKTLTLEWDDWRSTSAKPSTSVLCPLAYSVYSNGGIVYTKTITDCGKSTSSTAKPSTTAWTSVPCPLAYSVYSNGGIVYTKTITDCGTSTPTAATWSNWNGYNGNGNGYNNNNNGNGNGNGYKNGYNNNGNVVTSTCGYKSTTLIQSKPYEVSVSCGTTSSCKTDAAKVTSSCSTEWASWSSTATPSVSSTCYYGASCTTFHEEKSPYAPTSSCSQTSWCSTATAVGLPSPSSNSKCSTYTIPGQTSCSAVPITSTITKVITVPADSTTGYNSWTSIYNGNGASQCVPSTQTFTACVGGAIAQSLSSTCLTVPGSCSTYHIEQPPYSAVTTCSSTCTTATVQITGTASCSTSVSTSTCPTGSATGPGGVSASTWASWASPSVTGVKSYTGGASVNAGFIGQAMIVVGAIAGAGAFFL